MSDNQEENNTNEQNEIRLENAEGSTSEEVQELVREIHQDFSNDSVPLEDSLFGDTQPQQPENPISAMEQLIKNNADPENSNPDPETHPSNETNQTVDNHPEEEQNTVDKIENAENQPPGPEQPIQVVVEPENETEQVNPNTQIADNTNTPIQVATPQNLNEETFNPPIEVINNFNNQNNHTIPEKPKPTTFKQMVYDSYHELEEKAGKEEAKQLVKQLIRNTILFAAGSYFISSFAKFIDELK